MLRKSHRIRIIQAIASRLGADSWHNIDLVLNEFEVPEYLENGTSNKNSYITLRIRQAGDDQLREIAEHCGVPVTDIVGVAVASESAVRWDPDNFRLFVSHLSGDKEAVHEIRHALLPRGISAFVAHDDITPNSEWQRVILAALSTCEAMAAYLTPSFHHSKWTDQEIGFALARDIPILGLRVGADPHGFMSSRQGLSALRQSPSQLGDSIVDALMGDVRTAETMRMRIVGSFVSAQSFANAKIAAAAIERHKDAFLEQDWKAIQGALESNGQIAQAHGVPRKIRSILQEKLPSADDGVDVLVW